MTLQEFIDGDLRVELDDLSKLVYSDFQLVNDINTVLFATNTMLVKYDSEILSEVADITFSNGSADLPDDYMSVTYVFDDWNVEAIPMVDYLIVGSKIYSSTKTVLHMQYTPVMQKLGLTDDIPYPSWLMEQVKRFIIMLAKKEISKTDQSLYALIEADIKFITVRRELGYIYRDPPFFV